MVVDVELAACWVGG